MISYVFDYNHAFGHDHGEALGHDHDDAFRQVTHHHGHACACITNHRFPSTILAYYWVRCSDRRVAEEERTCSLDVKTGLRKSEREIVRGVKVCVCVCVCLKERERITCEGGGQSRRERGPQQQPESECVCVCQCESVYACLCVCECMCV